MTITDLTTKAPHRRLIGLTSHPRSAAALLIVGFTGATGGATATQDITSWTFAPNAPQPPNPPSALGVVPASATSVTLAWTTNSINETGFYLDRATDQNFTDNLITETLPAGISTFTDTPNGLAPNNTFYYRIRAFNLAGPSANSNVAGVTIPLAPPKPTNAVVQSVTTNQITLSWNDNSGPLATYFDILRSVNGGAFTDYLHLPPSSVVQGGSIPAIYDWTDTGVSPGNLYEYHIEAVNSSGYNDFLGADAETTHIAADRI